MKLILYILVTATFALTTQSFALEKADALKPKIYKTSSKKIVQKLKALKEKTLRSRNTPGLLKVSETVKSNPSDLHALNCSEYTSSLVFENWCVEQKNFEDIDIERLTFCAKQTFTNVSEALCYFGDISSHKVSSCYYETATPIAEQACMTDKENINTIADLGEAIEEIVPLEVYLYTTGSTLFEFSDEIKLMEEYREEGLKKLEELGPMIDKLIEDLIGHDDLSKKLERLLPETDTSTPKSELEI